MGYTGGDARERRKGKEPAMKAAIYTRYGKAETVRIAEMPVPAPGPGEMLVKVRAASLTTADWRMRAAAYPGILWLPGRLMTGLLAPKNPVLGTDLAGEVVATGAGVTRFRTGQRVFGFAGRGGHAEYALVREDGAIVATPDGMTDAEAAALPFGALTALVFLRDVAKVSPGQSVLVVGGSGGVGVYAVQIARALGAHVTATASAEKVALVRSLGAHRVIDWRREDVSAARDAYDLVFDTVGATTWPGMLRALKRRGLFLPLNYKGRELWHLLLSKITRGPRIVLHVNPDRAEDLQTLLEMVADGRLRPVIDRRFALDDIVAAHRYVEGRSRKGAVVIDVAPATPAAAAA